MITYDIKKHTQDILEENNILIIQDIDGVCIPLVKDPLKREISLNYINAASRLVDKFFVLTCGEHEGRRGVNRIIERTLKSIKEPHEKGLYLPGLAGCGVEFQDRYGNNKILGLGKDEIDFLKKVPDRMYKLLFNELIRIFPKESSNRIKELCNVAICDTRFTPTLNLNEILILADKNIELQKELQNMMLKIMEKLINYTKNTNLENSFQLHMMPNLGVKGGKEILKESTIKDIGTTDIQFIINGAIKEAGLLVLLNKYLKVKKNIYPFGEDFNVRDCPRSHKELLKLCKEKISLDDMPMLIGVGDTVTSEWNSKTNNYQRGGSDRGFLTLIKELGEIYNTNNKVIFVNSSNSQVKRPRLSNLNSSGITDKDDNLKIDIVIEEGPSQYINWFEMISNNKC